MKIDIPRSIPMEKLCAFAESVDCKVVRTRDDGIALRPKAAPGNVIAMPTRRRALPWQGPTGPSAA